MLKANKNYFFESVEKAKVLDENIPLILISGIMCNEKLWSKQQEKLSKDIKIIIPKVTQKISIKDLAAEIVTKSESVFNIIGFSSGGYVAQEILRQAPEKVRKLILMNTSGGEYSQKQQEMRCNFIKICEEKGVKIGLDAFVTKLNSTYLIADTNVLEYTKKMIEEISPETFYEQFKSVYEYNQSAPDLSQIECPTLVIASDNDPFMTKDAYDEMVNLIPKAELKLIHGGGHMLPVSRSEEVNTLINSFFNYPKINQQKRLDSYA